MNKSDWLASRCPNEVTEPDALGRSLARLDHCATNDAAWFGGPHGMFVDVPVSDLRALLAEYRHVLGANERLAKLGRVMEAERNELAERVGMGGARRNRSATPVEPEWFPIGVAPCDGRQILLSAPTWDGVTEREWPNKQAMFRDLADWIDPPTHWTAAPKLPAL